MAGELSRGLEYMAEHQAPMWVITALNKGDCGRMTDFPESSMGVTEKVSHDGDPHKVFKGGRP